jgi:hypothetical protein
MTTGTASIQVDQSNISTNTASRIVTMINEIPIALVLVDILIPSLFAHLTSIIRRLSTKCKQNLTLG